MIVRLELAVGAAAILVYRFGPLSDTAAVALYSAIAIAAALAILAGALRRPRAAAAPWLAFAAGVGLIVAGDTVFDVEALVGRQPGTPSAADALYLLGYPFCALGLVLLIRRAGWRRSRASFVDGVIAAVAIGTVVWSPLFATFRASSHASLAERLTVAAYPTWDLLLLALLVSFALSRRLWSQWIGLLLAAVLFLLLGDLLWADSVSNYALGDWLDSMWLVSYVLWGAAALAPATDPVEEPEADDVESPFTLRRFAILAVPVAVLPCSLAGIVIAGEHLRTADVLLTAAVMLFLLARLGWSTRGLEAAHARLVQSNRLKDDVISVVSHDLRTPLTSIMGYLELALDPETSDDERREYLDVAMRNSHRLSRLVEDLLFVSRVRSGRAALDVEEVDVGELAREAVAAALPSASAGGIDLRYRSGPRGTVVADPHRIAIVLENLLSNAIKFTSEGGAVEVSVEERAGGVALQVRDTGCGIAEDDTRHVFERFYRGRRAQGQPGAGLGLAIVQAIVEAHGGSVAVRSRLGRGSTFEVLLPRGAPVSSVHAGAQSEHAHA